MPITLAHPIAAVPFARWFPLPALVAGSIAPDVGYYLPIPVSGTATHSALGVLCWNLPIGLALLLAFRLSAGPAATLVPWRVTLRPPTPSTQTRAAPTLLAIAIGATTHIVWDSFTHTAGFAVRHGDLLRATVIEPHKVYNVLGYVSSLLGTAAVAYLLFRHARRVRPDRVVSPARRRILGAALLSAPLLGAALAVGDPITRVSTYDLVRHVLVGATQATICAWIGYAAWWHLVLSGRRGRGPEAERGSGFRPRARR